MTIYELFNSIKTTAGTNAKIELLENNINDTVKIVFSDTYDTKRKYYVKKLPEIIVNGTYTIDNDYERFHNVLDILCAREVTGNAAIECLVNIISKFKKEDQEILKCVIDHNLKIGVSIETITKIIGDEAPEKFEVTLAQHLEKVKGVNPLDGTFYASRKMDGARCVGIIDKKNGKVTIDFISRQGKKFTTLENLKEGLEWYVRNLEDGKYVTDGEICKVDENGDEDFQAIMKEIRRKDYTIPDPCYQMFDFCTYDEFIGNTTSKNFSERYSLMNSMISENEFKTIKVAKQELIKSQEDFDRWERYVAEGNWEGFMLRKNVPFETGRTKNLLKVKKFLDNEYIVKDVEIAEMTTAEPGKGNVIYTGVKSLIIEHKGCNVHVGSGLTKEQRIEWYNDNSKIIGKTITVKYFEETISQEGNYSLRFPILKYVYENGRDC